jgi:hypothetical protein
MDDSEHDQNSYHRRDISISICDDDDRDTRYDRAKYGDESKYKNNQCERNKIRKSPMSDNDTEYDQSNRCQECINESNDRLRSEYDTKSIPDLSSNDRIFVIKKCKVAITHLSEEYLDLSPLNNEDIREYESEKKLHQDESSISDMSEYPLTSRLEILGTKNISCSFLESEIDRRTVFYLFDNFLSLSSDDRGSSYELLDISSDLRDDGDEYKCNNRYKEYIEDSHHDIGRRILQSETMSSIFSSFLSPVMDLMSDEFPCL